MARILVAEDDAFMLRLLAMWLGRNGHDVTEAQNGDAAQAAIMELKHVSNRFSCNRHRWTCAFC